ncbi:MAG TPA: cytochrome c, partial [Candidatus Methylomirabilis sp.]|nr:cytochrome c [Candidatus Methylomirabilis sp.]
MKMKISTWCLRGLILTGMLLLFAPWGWERAWSATHKRSGTAGRAHMAGEMYYGNPEIGKKLFETRGCAECHAVRGVGGTLGPDLGKMYHEHNVLQMAARFWSHSPAMLKTLQGMEREWPKLQKGDLAHIIAYLHSPEVIGNPESGKRVFADKGCITCHAVKGEGGKIGPDLVTGPHPHTQLDFVAAMWNHFPQMVAMMEAMKIPKVEFKDEEMVDLLAFLAQA